MEFSPNATITQSKEPPPPPLPSTSSSLEERVEFQTILANNNSPPISPPPSEISPEKLQEIYCNKQKNEPIPMREDSDMSLRAHQFRATVMSQTQPGSMVPSLSYSHSHSTTPREISLDIKHASAPRTPTECSGGFGDESSAKTRWFLTGWWVIFSFVVLLAAR